MNSINNINTPTSANLVSNIPVKTQIMPKNNPNASSSSDQVEQTSIDRDVPKHEKHETNHGYIYDLKKKLSNKMGELVNRIVTKQVNARLLSGLPPNVKAEVQENIEGTIKNMVTDITSKSLDTGENLIKASPAVGNVVSAVSAADNVLAGVKNTRDSVLKIKKEINKVQEQLNNVNTGLVDNATQKFNTLNPVNAGLNNIPRQDLNVVNQTGGGPIISNNLQTIINRAHRSVAQHRTDVHQLIDHRNKKTTKKHRTQTGGGTIISNNLDTIMNRAHHSVAQHHADVHQLIDHRNKKTTKKHRTQTGGGEHPNDLLHNIILQRATKSIDDFHKTTKKMQR